MNESNDPQWARCPAGYLVSLKDEEKININQQSQNKNQLKKDRVTGFLFVLMFVLALLVGLI